VLQFPERIEFLVDMPLTKAEKVDKKALIENMRKNISLF
jgi:non-ribosomal peptide synthetase component E (peptide arylation enzyme)